MKQAVKPNTAGLALGTFLGLVHALWALLVAMDLAQALVEWAFALHFMSNPYTIQAFNFGTAVVLVAFTFIVGYAGGWVLATVWNWAMKKK